MTREEWRNSSQNARNNPKLTASEAKRITDEAIAGDQKWEVQEKINARRQAERAAECGGSLGKLIAPAKFDAAIPRPRCQAGAGAYGTYFVHNSQKYGIKLFRDPSEADFDAEFDLLGKAHAAKVNVPEPLSLTALQPANNSRIYDDEPRAVTMVLSHMRNYREAGDIYSSTGSNLENAPLIVRVKAAREFRKLHQEGLAHGDIHNGNVMVSERAKKVGIVDFGYATELDSPPHSQHFRDGIQNLSHDLMRLPAFVGMPQSQASDFLERNKSVINNIEKQAESWRERQSLNNWDKFELAVKRFHDALETELLWDDRKPRSRLISGADQSRIPGLTRRIVTANLNTFQREALERGQNFGNLTFFQEAAKDLGVKPPRLFLALKPERDARLAKQRQKPFGTPFSAPKPKAPAAATTPAAPLGKFGTRTRALLGTFGKRTRALAADLPGATPAGRLSLAARMQRIMARSGNKNMSLEAALRLARKEQRGFSSWKD